MSDFSDITKFREYFHKVVNIEDYPEFRETAEKIGRYFLENADYSEENYSKFPYTPESFNERMTKIYKDFEEGMFEPIFWDSGIITYPAIVGESGGGELVTEPKQYNVGRFSDAVIKERITQAAPFNLLDGVWLQNILQARPSDEVQSRLFSIWSDEAGNGEAEQNHPNVYEALLRSQEIYLPPVTSKAFAEYSVFFDEAFVNPVFQASMSLFPEKFFPELLGMTLYLEWEATPTLYATVKSYERRGFDPTFYSLHVAIDNIGRGHGALAKEAIILYLEDKREEGGDAPVQDSWNRIWNGYVTWATLSGFGRKFLERALRIDRKQINIDLRDPSKPKCFPDLKENAQERMIALIESRADIADTPHRAINLGGQSLSKLFSNPTQLLEGLVSQGYVDPNHPRDSRFLKLLEFDGPMYKIFNAEDIDVILDWIESLRDNPVTCTNPIVPPDPSQTPLEVQMQNLLASKESIGSISHRGISLPLADGTTKTINELFNDIPALMEAMVRGGWITPGSIDDSVFYTRLITNNGPMSGFFSDPTELKLVENWILDGAKSPSSTLITPLALTTSIDSSLSENLASGAPLIFAKRRPLIGMGSVH